MKEVALKHICYKESSSLKQKELLQNGDHPVYGASGIAGYLNTYHQKKAYIGIVKDGSGIGRVDFYPPQTSLIGTMQYILPKEGFDIRYIGYCLQSLDLSKYKQGAAIPHIYFRDYGERIVKVTEDKGEQQRIVSRLDAAFAHIDEIKANAKEQISEARKLFQRCLAKAMEPKEGWGEKRICDIADTCLGKMLDKAKNKGSFQPYLRNLNVRWDGFNFDDILEMKFEEGEDERYGIKKGDLIVCEGGEPGRCAIWYEEIANMKIQKALHRVRPHKGMDSRFILYTFMLYSINGIIEKHVIGATIKHLTGQVLKNLIISFPHLSEQQHIVARLDALSAHVKEMEEINQEIISECDALKQSMLRKVFE